MRRHHPDHQRDIPISMAVHWQLVGASIRCAFEKEDWEIAAEAIDEWVRRHDPDGVPMPAHTGYQWKRLFLPDGTVLRTVFAGKNHHCVVQSDQILYNGQAVTPSGFVNAVGGIRRNAWRSTWILFPDTKQWQLADALRPRKPPRRARKTAPAGIIDKRDKLDKFDKVDKLGTQQAPAAPLCSAPKPVAAPENPAMASISAEPCLQDDSDQEVEPDYPNRSTDPHASVATTVSTPPCSRGADRRSGAPAWLSPVLRDELLLLLNRICVPRKHGRETGASTTGSSPPG